MEVQRIKSIDIFRGLCMTWMVLNHLIDWWLLSSSSELHNATIMILDSIGASGFLFISGVSISMSYRRRQIKARTSEDMNMRIVKNSYFFRALFLFIIAISYNIPIAIVLNNPSYIWTWFVLLTVAVSMFMVWPLLYTSKIVRVSVGFFIIIANQAILNFLLGFRYEFNIFGILYHVLYNNIYQDPILSFFPFFLLGTVFGDILFDSYLNNRSINKKVDLKKRLLIPAILIGICLIIIGILIKFPDFLYRQRFSWIIYSLGIETLLLSMLLLFENFVMINIKKSYKLLFYYSYYSLTVYLGHYLLYFLFLNRLNSYNIWFFILATFILLGLLLRFIYKKFQYKASVKIQISRLSLDLTLKIEEKKHYKIRK
jgi:uncharacterized membrane protein